MWFGFYGMFYISTINVDIAGGLLDYQRRNDYKDQYNQLPPSGLPVGKSITPRARAHLPAGIRYREVKPDGATT